MKRRIIILIALYFITSSCNSVYGQTNTDSLISSGMMLELKNDTLFSNTRLTFFVGQKIIVGNGSEPGGYYRSVIYKNAAIVPSIWGQDKRFENAIENHVNKKKSREKVKGSLLPGNVLTI